jgi:menaquinol-cytochrome c reductase iron-sulfur subunit
VKADQRPSQAEPAGDPADEPRAPGDEALNRRQFLSILSLSLGGIAAALVGVPVIGALFAPLFHEPAGIWRSVGPVDKFHVGETVEVSFMDSSPLPWAGVSAQTAAWLRRTSDQDFVAYAINCTHLGCPVHWLPDADLFVCPCHGGVYYSNGKVAAGPPPRPLNQYPVRVTNGQVEIQTSPVPITTF